MQYMIADERNPNMGLNNKICKDPKYWCRLHKVWLSEEDVERKHCKNKLDAYMIEHRRCYNLEKKEGGNNDD